MISIDCVIPLQVTHPKKVTILTGVVIFIKMLYPYHNSGSSTSKSTNHV